MASAGSGGLRRIKKFSSSSALDSSYKSGESGSASSSHASRVSTGGTMRLSTGNSSLRSTAAHTRARSHSQAQNNHDTSTQAAYGNSAQAQRFARKAASTAQLANHQDGQPPPQPQKVITIEALLSQKPEFLQDSIHDLRHIVLSKGVPADVEGNSQLRVYVWSIFLGVPPMKTADYVSLVRRGASASYSKIRNDTFRTLATDPLFRRRVSEASIIRLLNAFQWRMKDQGLDAQYVQGMNVIAAPFLYAAKSEVEAFSLFSVFIQRECPGYVRPTMEGVHGGLKLVDQCLETVDRKLYDHLKAKALSAELYAFPSVLTLSACTPPLPEVLKLWDFLMAYGAHLNILCVVAQLMIMREELLAADSPMKLLRQFPPLEARNIITLAGNLVKRIPTELFDAVVQHTK